MGKVWLVGAGPGDPELLTLKALRTLEKADLILFDSLVSEAIRMLFPKAVPAFYVGKRKGDHSIAQKDLNTLLVKKAKEGLNVVRLKGGDPFVFGRGSEEMLALMKSGIDVEMVPGITAASACNSRAGIPLTHRGLSQGCTFVTAHAESELNLNWSGLARIDHTIVFYMGISRAALIQKELIANGMAGNTPVAVIENGCRPEQREFVSTLDGLVNLIETHQIQSPALITVGNVAGFSSRLSPDKAFSLPEFNMNCA